MALYHIAWWIYLFVDDDSATSFGDRLYFFIYLTNWSYTVLTLTTLYWAIVVSVAYRKYSKEGYITNQVGISMKILWTLENITFLPALVVTILYWLAVFSPGKTLKKIRELIVYHVAY